MIAILWVWYLVWYSDFFKTTSRPLSDEFRLISDFSAHGASSMNDNTYAPLLLSGGYARGCEVRDAIGSFGPIFEIPGSQVIAKIWFPA